VPVSTVKGLFTQRERWARGYIQTLSQFGLTRWTAIPWAKQAGLVWSLVSRLLLVYLLSLWGLPVFVLLMADSVNTAHKAGWRATLVALAFPVEMLYAWLITAAIASGYWKQLTKTGKTDTKQLLPAKPILLTFDDAFVSDTEATPVLQKYGFNAVAFVITGYANGDYGSLYAGWGTIQTMARDGWMIQLHAGECGHAFLPHAPASCLAGLDRSLTSPSARQPSRRTWTSRQAGSPPSSRPRSAPGATGTTHGSPTGRASSRPSSSST
jgi:Polysaccharide deacetylase